MKDAFDAINLGTHQGNIVININCDTVEPLSAVLNASLTGPSVYSTVLIRPAGGGARTVSGAIAGHLIDLNGADGVTIDGLDAGGNSLTIENTSATSATSTIRFINDASSNTVTHCTIKGAGTDAAAGTIFFSTGTTTGNIGNAITNNVNTITSSGANFPVNAIYSAGTSAAIFNSGTISGNNIQDYFSATLASAGINLSATGNSNWSITNNRLFQTATRIGTTGNTHNGIFVGTGEGYTISGNIIGFANAAGTGTTNLIGNSVDLPGFPASYTPAGTPTVTGYRAINATFTAGGAVSNIQGNTIAGHAIYSSATANEFIAILVGAGNANIGTAPKNIIGSESGAGGVGTPASIYAVTTGTGSQVVGIFAITTNTMSVQNNTFGRIDAVGTSATAAGGFTGIVTQGAAGVHNTSSNIIGNTTAANIRIGFTTTTGVATDPLTNAGILVSTTTATTGSLVGINNSATGATLNINTNIIRNLISSVSHTGAVSSFLGIFNSGAVTTTINITNNQLGTATAPAATYTGTANQINGIISSGGTAMKTPRMRSPQKQCWDWSDESLMQRIRPVTLDLIWCPFGQPELAPAYRRPKVVLSSGLSIPIVLLVHARFFSCCNCPPIRWIARFRASGSNGRLGSKPRRSIVHASRRARYSSLSTFVLPAGRSGSPDETTGAGPRAPAPGTRAQMNKPIEADASTAVIAYLTL